MPSTANAPAADERTVAMNRLGKLKASMSGQLVGVATWRTQQRRGISADRRYREPHGASGRRTETGIIESCFAEVKWNMRQAPGFSQTAR